MSIPATRDDFKAFCLRTLGDGVLQVNVSDDQVEDRIDQAFYMYQQYHMDGTVKNFLRHEVTPSVMHFTGLPSVPFQNHERLVGQTSNAHGPACAGTPPDANAIYMFGTNGPVAYIATGPSTSQAGDGKPFLEGEVVVGLQSGATATIAASTPAVPASGNTAAVPAFHAIELGDMDNKFFLIPDDIIAVTKIFAPFDSRISADILFDPQSQFNMSLLSNFTSNSIIPYVVGRQYQQLLNDTFRGRPGIRFSRHQQRLYVDVNWYSTFQPHQFIVVECYQTVDPGSFADVWSDRWLQDYATALIKLQWGQNLSKFGGIALPGGVTLDPNSMKAEAKEEIKDLEERLRTEFQLTIDFMVGECLSTPTSTSRPSRRNRPLSKT